MIPAPALYAVHLPCYGEPDWYLGRDADGDLGAAVAGCGAAAKFSAFAEAHAAAERSHIYGAAVVSVLPSAMAEAERLARAGRAEAHQQTRSAP